MDRRDRSVIGMIGCCVLLDRGDLGDLGDVFIPT